MNPEEIIDEKNTEIAIKVSNITKKFKVYLDKGHTLKEKTLFRKRRAYEERKVLKGISFHVKKGEAIGLIGHNGCGKSTILKLLTRIMYPDSGTIEMRGRVSSLIELGAGFHPDMSGRENIYINASIFGLNKSEIDLRVNDIIEFSELEDYIDNPVRTYSSGMYMRLAFAVAIHVDADILLIDEILAVGDAAFQAKCFNRMREIKASGTTIVIVSHSLGQIEEICERTIWIDKGNIHQEGIPREVHRAYTEYMSKRMADREKNIPKETENEPPVQYEKAVKIKSVKLKDEKGNEKNSFVTGEPAMIECEFESGTDRKEKVSIELVIVRNDGLECYETNTFREGFALMDLRGSGMFRCRIDKMNLITGEYWIEMAIRKPDAFPYDYKEKAYKFTMSSVDRERGIAKIDHEWLFDAMYEQTGEKH